MEYKVYGNVIVVRIDPNEEIMSCIEEVADKERITFASFSGIGAVKEITGGLFNPEKKKYEALCFEGYYEITSMIGNITTLNGNPYIHMHCNWANDKCKTYGGHVTSAVVSVAAEIFITTYSGNVHRSFNKETGFNQMEFNIPFST